MDSSLILDSGLLPTLQPNSFSWDRALVIRPNFGMAMANKGYSLLHYALRNHLEHNYLLIQDDALYASSGKSGLRGMDDGSVYVIGQSDFANRTLRILKMVRAALIYLSLAVHWEASQLP